LSSIPRAKSSVRVYSGDQLLLLAGDWLFRTGKRKKEKEKKRRE
jgi:hypothetical protein